ncbi:hypothetical protein LI951_09635 [Enterococcus sp. BWT-B8]|uniref:hypothetical protein n=1 Tax=Enterococcus sp. BWT-B8 TaxID=2885157 RepID=UPI001E5E5F67|nr:hypothetical protein [Enterococcus sp. BWT-B8]MCB5952325.1 hypothetical protein [Enterococcus sp. BWT-B8]
MKKILTLALAVLFIGTLSACNKSKTKETNTTAESSAQSNETSSSISNDSVSSDQQNTSEPATTISSVDDVRKVTPEEDVSTLRRQLYEAGINSSGMTDSKIEEYAKQAKEKDIDFVTYVEENILN